MRVLSIIGTRPEAVKMAPVIQALGHEPGVESKVIVTAQHREMMDQVLNLFQIKPDVDLNIMAPNQSLAQLSAALFSNLDVVLRDLKPDWVLAQGDTTTVMVSSLLAYYNQIQFGHVEAGLRTHDKWQPFPEEINRRVAGVTADLHFAPTDWARDNLLRENVPNNQIIVTGNPVIDALHQIIRLPDDEFSIELLKELKVGLNSSRKLVLITAHRRENFGKPLEQICQALLQLADQYKGEIQFLYPVHLNPNVQKTVYSLLDDHPYIRLMKPFEYSSMIHIMKMATLVLTDSGGLQEEAPSLGVPVLVLRETTERPEGIQAGTVRLVGTSTENIIRETRRLLDDPESYKQMTRSINPYGDGKAANRIVNALHGKGNDIYEKTPK